MHYFPIYGCSALKQSNLREKECRGRRHQCVNGSQQQMITHRCIIVLIDPQIPRATVIKQQLNAPTQLCMDHTDSHMDISVGHLQIPQMEPLVAFVISNHIRRVHTCTIPLLMCNPRSTQQALLPSADLCMTPLDFLSAETTTAHSKISVRRRHSSKKQGLL